MLESKHLIYLLPIWSYIIQSGSLGVGVQGPALILILVSAIGSNILMIDLYMLAIGPEPLTCSFVWGGAAKVNIRTSD